MKLLKSKKFLNYFVRFIATAVVIIIISCSMTINSVDQPTTITAGDVFHATLNAHVHTNSGQSSKLMIAILVPKAWNARALATLTFTSQATTGIQGMTPVGVGVPAPNANGLDWSTNLAAKIGSGDNLINDWEWIAYYSNSAYTLPDNDDVDITVSVSIPTTPDNISFKLGYVIANSTDGLSTTDYYGAFFPGCVKVVGTGDLIDFCNPQLSSVEPRIALDNDIITIGFDEGVTSSQLDGIDDVYFCATGITTTGERIEICNQAASSKMVALGAGRFRIDLWPRKYFSLTETQKLAKIEYFFTNVDNTKSVGYAAGTDPFQFTFSCQ